jgi:hypothetical protein
MIEYTLKTNDGKELKTCIPAQEIIGGERYVKVDDLVKYFDNDIKRFEAFDPAKGDQNNPPIKSKAQLERKKIVIKEAVRILTQIRDSMIILRDGYPESVQVDIPSNCYKKS